MFLWTKPKGLKTFGKTLEEAKQSAALAANQGLYNGFLAAGLFWSLIVKNAHTALHFKVFFLACVAVAGVYGGFTSSRKIMVVQTLPALIALSLLIYNC
jgi:putative membrane protein